MLKFTPQQQALILNARRRWDAMQRNMAAQHGFAVNDANGKFIAFDELVELLSIEKLLERRPKSFPDSCWAFRAQAAKSASP